MAERYVATQPRPTRQSREISIKIASNKLTSLQQDDTLVPIDVEFPNTPNVTSEGAPVTQSATTKDGRSTYKALEGRPQNIQTNATTFTHHVRTPESPNLHFFTTTGDGNVRYMSYPSFDIDHTIKAHTSACLSIQLAPNARYLAIGGSDALISLWDTTDFFCHRTLSSEVGGAIRNLSWSFDGRYICGACDEAGCGGNGLDIFHAETGEIVYTVPTGGGINTGIPDVAWHPSRYWLAYSITADGPGSANSGGLRVVGAAGGGL